MEIRVRMWLLVSFCFLGITIFQVSGADNSTQMLYFSLTIDLSVNYSEAVHKLSPFDLGSWLVTNLTVTTSCEQGTCSCKPGYKWTDKVCRAQQCCGTGSCSFSHSVADTCVADTAVTVTGSIQLPAQAYQNCLALQSDSKYTRCNDDLTKKMTNVFSTLSGFDVLSITKYSVGSVIAAFQVMFASSVSSQLLLQLSGQLAGSLNATLKLETSGIVQINMPPNPVSYQSQRLVTCTTQQSLGTLPTWQLQKQGDVYNITNGTEATVTSDSMNSTVSLKNITELWKGNYMCAYVVVANSTTITHKASATMDVALKPSIVISTEPQYPLCTSSDGLLNVQINCQVALNSENYSVSFSSPDITAAVNMQAYSYEQSTYSATTVVNCASSISNTVICTFVNRCNQSANTSTSISIIPYNEKYCVAEGQWPNTKAGFSAVLPCIGATGKIWRSCSASAAWGAPEPRCVYQSLYDTLQKSLIVNSGLGTVDLNAAEVFSRLQGATNNSALINSFSNVDTAVAVLSNLQSKLSKIVNVSAVNDFLKSSSNLLDTSLQDSWRNGSSSNSSALAELYLSSVEDLIRKADLTRADSNTNVQVDTCNSTACNNTVFNVTVTVQGTNSTWKTAGFQQLQNYLPSSDNVSLNSIVVSTTTEDKLVDSFKITIEFKLLSPRPRNVRIHCVWWDNSSRRWSFNGCQWQGAGSPNLCICSHLSSFAILMSKSPIDLPGTSEMTYAGLSVSIVSLLICLVIEMTVWSAVVKTNTLYLRHTAHVNICLCLLIADCCFLASSIGEIDPIWCRTSAVLKHFCYLAMFFWMLCLSTTLLHQAIFLFHNVSKKNYLRFSLVLGYICPFLIVFITFLTNGAGVEGSYYSNKGCWLVYIGSLQGSIFTFVIPVGIIIFINVFSMLVVMMKLLDRPMTTDKSHDKETNAAKTVVRTVILLTPIFGITWILGFACMILDLTAGTVSLAVNYAFTLLNAFQGFFILLTTCIGDKMVREALLSRFRKNAAASVSESTTKLDSSWKK